MALLHEGQLKAGERVLLHGGTSGVGLIMAQIAKALGAEVFATVGSDEKCALLKEYGVTPINHRTAPFAEQVMALTNNEGVDVVIDILGAPMMEAHFKLLRRGGRMVSLAMMEGNTVESLKLSGFFMKNLRWSAATLRSKPLAEKAAFVETVRREIWPQVASGLIKPAIDSVFPLAQAEKALVRMQERLHIGKILLEVR
jgi:NADPH:quinone reductase-like Zn-dependent oxidoreductase